VASAAAAVAIAFAFILSRVTRLPGTDDFTFAQHIAQFPSLVAWVSDRYATWSGRIVPEAWLYVYSSAPLWLWQITSLLLTLAFLFILLRIAALFDERAWSAPVIVVSGGLLFLMDDTVLHGGYFWVTGAMNYFWAVPFALAAAYPVIRLYARRPAPRAWLVIASSIGGLVASVSSEQTGAVLVVLLGLILIDRIVAVRRGADRYHAWITAIVFVASLAGFLVLMLAPGNALRSEFDAQYWLPEFFQVPFPVRLHSSVRFVVDGLVNRSGVALPALWIALLTLYLRVRPSRSFAHHAVALTAVAGLALTLLRPLHPGQRLFDLKAAWRAPLEGPIDTVILAMWIALLIATAVAPALLLRSYGGLLASLLVFAAIASLAVITTSASMYASGPRVLFVPSLLILLGFYGLFLSATRDDARLRQWASVSVALIAAAEYLYSLSAITSQT